MADDKKPKGLRAALKALQDVGTDLTTLEVKTYTGDLAGKMVGDKIDWKQIKPDQGTGVTLVAATKIDFDLDVTNYRVEADSDVRRDLVELHMASVESSMKGRAAMLRMFLDLIPAPK